VGEHDDVVREGDQEGPERALGEWEERLPAVRLVRPRLASIVASPPLTLTGSTPAPLPTTPEQR